MSVNNVNSLYQTQGVQGSTSYTTLSQDDGGGVDIGKLLLGGLGTVVTIGLGVAAYKSGKQSSLTKESDNVFTTMCNGVKNWLGKNGDDVANGVKKYVDLDDVNSLTDSQKIAKAQEVLDATKNNLTVSNNKALKHMENIEDITNSLFKKGEDGKLTEDFIEKIDDTLFAKINGTKGLEGAFELTEAGQLKINGTEGLKKFQAYFEKRNASYYYDISWYDTNSEIKSNELNDLFVITSQYYKNKQTNIANKFNIVNRNRVLCSKEANNILNTPWIKETINKEADFKYMAQSKYYKEHKELLITRAKKAGFGDDDIKKLFPSGGG